MTTLITEQKLINKLADGFGGINGIKRVYRYSETPDTLTEAQLPAVVFVPTAFTAESKAHFNFHRNQIEITAVLFVAQRQTAGGRLKFLESRAIPFLQLVRKKFQEQAIINGLLGLGLTNATTFTGTYGAGGTWLTHNSIEHIGCVFRWTFIEIS